MARTIQNFDNVVAPGGNFPSGRIKDEVPGVSSGTPVDEQVYGDVHQFFAQLMRVAGVTADGDPDSTANNFQFIDALAKATMGVWEDASSLLVNGWVVSAGSVFEMRISGSSNLDARFGDVEFRGAIENPDVFNNPTILTMPVGFRTAYPEVRLTAGSSASTFTFQVITLATNGVMQITSNVTNLQDNNAPLYMSGVKFSRFAAP